MAPGTLDEFPELSEALMLRLGSHNNQLTLTDPFYKEMSLLGAAEVIVGQNHHGKTATINIARTHYDALDPAKREAFAKFMCSFAEKLGITTVELGPYIPKSDRYEDRFPPENAPFFRGMGGRTPSETRYEQIRGIGQQGTLNLSTPAKPLKQILEEKADKCGTRLYPGYTLNTFITTDAEVRRQQTGNASVHRALTTLLQPQSGLRQGRVITLVGNMGHGKSHLVVGHQRDDLTAYNSQLRDLQPGQKLHPPGIFYLDMAGLLDDIWKAYQRDIESKQGERKHEVEKILKPLYEETRFLVIEGINRVTGRNPKTTLLNIIEIMNRTLGRNGLVILVSPIPLRQVFPAASLTKEKEALYSEITRGVVLQMPPFNGMPTRTRRRFFYDALGRCTNIPADEIEDVFRRAYSGSDNPLASLMEDPKTSYGLVFGVAQSAGAAYDPNRSPGQLRSLVTSACESRLQGQISLPLPDRR